MYAFQPVISLRKLLFIVGTIAILMTLGGCASTKTNKEYTALTGDPLKVTSPELVRDVQDKIEAIKPKVKQVRTAVVGLTADNVEVRREGILGLIGGAEGDNTTGLYGDVVSLTLNAKKLSTSVANDANHTIAVEKENTSIKDSERQEQKKTLNRWGFWFLIPSLIILILSFVVTRIPEVALLMARFSGLLDSIRMLAVAGIATGLSLLTLATFILPIEIAIAIAGGVAFVAAVVVLIIYLLKYIKEEREKAAAAKAAATKATAVAVDIVQTIEKGKAAGEIVVTPKGKDPAQSVMKAFQSDHAAEFVEAVQKGQPIPIAP